MKKQLTQDQKSLIAKHNKDNLLKNYQQIEVDLLDADVMTQKQLDVLKKSNLSLDKKFKILVKKGLSYFGEEV
jgi:hypothetical protein|tara:strand:- start:46 stop:264 length:219 start_codon:yes stop_codon:yes gene_type:complete